MQLLNHIQSAINRFQANIGYARLGIVSSSNPDNSAIKVVIMPEEIETGFMPFCTPWIGWYAPPNAGDQCLVFFQEADKTVPIGALLLYWTQSMPPSGIALGEAIWMHSSGSFVKLSNNGRVLVGGNLAITTVGDGLQIAEGSNAKSGTATLNMGTATVTNTSVTSSSRILLQRTSLNGSSAIGELLPSTINAGASFIVNSYAENTVLVTQDNSIFYYLIIEPA